jgi:phenylacetate-CoA ligase
MSAPTLPATASWQHIPDLTAHQDQQLPTLLTWAARSPFYRSRIAALPTDRAGLARLPMTTKQDLRDGYPFRFLAVPAARLATYHESSGTAGVPTASYYTADDWTDLVDRFARKPE